MLEVLGDLVETKFAHVLASEPGLVPSGHLAQGGFEKPAGSPLKALPCLGDVELEESCFMHVSARLRSPVSVPAPGAA